jgi:integrase
MKADIQRYLKKVLLSDTTKITYSHYLGFFEAWLKKNGIDWRSIDDDLALDWLDENPAWSDATRNNAACAIKSFYRWKFGSEHPVLKLTVRREDSGPQRTLDWEMLQQLLASLDTSQPKGVRDLAIITLMVDTGLRSSEICRLELRLLDLADRKLDVIVKGGKWGKAVFFDYTASCLEAWLAIRGNFAAPGVHNIFVSVGGDRRGTRLTTSGLRTIFRRMGFKSDLGLISPHDMRRTFATLASKAGAPSRVVQVAGRWSSIQMVERYTRALTASDLQPYSPINRIMDVDLDS